MWQSRILSLAIPTLLKTLRVNILNEKPVTALLEGQKPFVLMFWHGSMLLPWWFMKKVQPSALISNSKDGQILAEILERWDYNVVRGSSSKGSKEAMEVMRRLIDYGHTVCITPDGPRGPRHELKMGGIRIAQTKNVPLVYCTVSYSKFSELKSWDSFQIPHVFGRACLSFSNPIMVSSELQGASLDSFRDHVQTEMQEAHQSCIRFINKSTDKSA
jgi:lysophospholipid acyltransferase (LPLAT)-like uncharacterized protein